MKWSLPLGMDSFEKVRTNNCYYVDKTGFIRELLGSFFETNLITRPRRFGKTMAMSMLAEFFDIRKDSRELFEGLEISKDKELCGKWMNQWPVLFVSLKDAEGNSFQDAYGMLQFIISSLCIEHAYLETSEAVDEADRRSFLRLKNREGDRTEIKSSLYILMRMMAAHYKKRVILLIDEYDVPLAKASDNGYYKEMLNVIRGFLGMTWKTNPSLKFAVVTGCLRIAKESIFTGANNFISNSVSGERYSGCFGFSEQEVRRLLEENGLPDHFEEIKKWYDGYLFGSREIYCPWDVMNHISMLQINPSAKPADYWKDTSHNDIIRRFIDLPELDVGGKCETLLAGGTIQETIVEDLTYDIANSSEENLWSILYLTGYLTRAAVGSAAAEGSDEDKIFLKIPNEEIRSLFAETVFKWFTDSVKKTDRQDLLHAWWNGDSKALTDQITDILFSTISYFDYKEDYYHAFTAGLFVGAGYEVSSNQEQGKGRADIIVKDRKNRRALIIEVKRSRAEQEMEKDCEAALEQIDRKQYAREILKGYRKIICYGAAFFEKECLVRGTEKKGSLD